MHFTKSYHKTEYSDVEAHTLFNFFLKEVSDVLAFFGLNFDVRSGQTTYSYNMGNHVWSFINGQVMSREQEEAFQVFLEEAKKDYDNFKEDVQ